MTPKAVLVADYGRGVASAPGVREALTAVAAGRAPVVWDPHPRGQEPVPGVTLATPNGAEARHFAPGHDGALLTATTARARELAGRWGATAVSVTLSGRGALLVSGDGAPSVLPAPVVPCPDPCGAGDRFAATAAGLLADGALPSEAVAGAVAAASAFVAAGGAASVRVGRPAPAAAAVRETAGDVVARVRAAGGTVVATGGCFDLLHAGHVSVLSQARALGDCLVVLLNSDDSVRRLKGESRPLQSAGRPRHRPVGARARRRRRRLRRGHPRRRARAAAARRLGQGRRLRPRRPPRSARARAVGRPGGRPALPDRQVHHLPHPGSSLPCLAPPPSEPSS